jgi:hypothetical protein
MKDRRRSNRPYTRMYGIFERRKLGPDRRHHRGITRVFFMGLKFFSRLFSVRSSG